MSEKGRTFKPSARVVRVDRQTGNRTVNGRPHGFNWTPLWEVVVTFDSHEEAAELCESLQEGGIVER